MKKRGFLEGAAAKGYSDELSPVEERLTCRTKVTQAAARAKAKGSSGDLKHVGNESVIDTRAAN